jgi:hypothetical protein
MTPPPRIYKIAASMLADDHRTPASAECRHWSGRAVRWSSCAETNPRDAGSKAQPAAHVNSYFFARSAISTSSGRFLLLPLMSRRTCRAQSWRQAGDGLRVVQLDEVDKRNSIVSRGLLQSLLKSCSFLSIGCPDR